MPLNLPLNSNLVDRTVRTKGGIFRSRTHPPAQTVRSKLPSKVSNAISMKPNRKKFQSQISNCKDKITEFDSKLNKRPQPLVVEEIVSNVVEIPSIRLAQDHFLSNELQVNGFTSKESNDKTVTKDSYEQSQTLVVNSVHSLVYQMEHCKLDQTTISNSKTLLTNSMSKEFDKNKIPWSCSREHITHEKNIKKQEPTSQMNCNRSNLNAGNVTLSQIGSEKSFLSVPNRLVSNPSLKKFETFIKNDSSKKLNESSIPVHVKVNKSALNDTITSTSVDKLKIGDNIKLDSKHADLFETELKTYHENLKKYDREAKEVVDKFTESLDEKGKIIRKYEEELSLFNNRICCLQQQLEDSLERTRQLESTVTTKNLPPATTTTTTTTEEIKSENVKLKETIKNLETKLAKRDLHIFNLKEVLSLETNKIKELNKAQEEINKLQRESIDKSREISVLRDELKYAAKMRTELVNEYDDKIVKLKKLLAIREYLLAKGKA